MIGILLHNVQLFRYFELTLYAISVTLNLEFQGLKQENNTVFHPLKYTTKRHKYPSGCFIVLIAKFSIANFHGSLRDGIICLSSRTVRLKAFMLRGIKCSFQILHQHCLR